MYDAVVRVLVARCDMMLVNLSAARSLAKRWLERQVEFVRTTENGSLNFHIVVAFTFYMFL